MGKGEFLRQRVRLRVKGLNFFRTRMVYQPIVDFRSREIVAFEALARINARSYFPEEILRQTYSKGQVVDFDLACFKIAFGVLPLLGKDQFLFVNAEPMTLGSLPERRKDFDVLLKGMKAYQTKLVFELTEGMKIRDLQRLKKGVAFLRQRGCRFALDDIVGIGSKLFALAGLKPEFIKIGRELVQGISKNSVHQGLLHRIAEVADRSGSVLIAEGLEKKRDLKWLRDHGVRFAQGYYLFHPYPLPLEKRS
jgi:EAL domain-containing protein (putative c-di-GMP-specific phosphodiesterase class I)